MTRVRRLYGAGLVLAILAGCFVYASLRSSPYLAELPFMPAWAGRWLDAHQDLRHLVGYGGLAFLAGLMLGGGRAVSRWLLIAGGLALMSAGLEALQFFRPGRFVDWKDVAWSWAGVVLGIGAAWGVRLRRG